MALKPSSFYRCLLTFSLLAGSASAQSKWTHMRSENLEMYSETTPVRSQETLRGLEQVRTFIVKSFGRPEGVLGTTCVVAFKAEEDFAHFRTKPDVVSYSLSGVDRDYVVLGLPETDAFEPGARAYAELLTRQLGLRPPSWLDEGLKSFYTSFTERGTELIAGDISPTRRKALLSEPWGSLDQVLGAVNSRAVRNQRFALIHMLLLGADYAPRFKDLVTELQAGTSSQAAFEKVYAKSLASIEKDLKTYSESASLVGTALAARSETYSITPGEPASPFDVNLALAGVTNVPGRENDVQAWFERLAGMNPERPEPWAGLGYVALRRGQSDIAAKNFEKAISLGSRDSGVLWTRSRIAHGDSLKDSEEAVRKQLDKEPARADLRVKLAALALDQRRPALAFSVLEPVKDVPAELSSRFLAELAYAQLGTGEKAAAKLTVSRLEDRSTSAMDKAEAARLKDFLAAPTRLTLGTNTTEAVLAAAQEKAEAQKAAAEARDKELAEAREKAAAEAREKAAEAREKVEARVREKAEADARQQAAEEARVKLATEAREKAAADAQEKKEARLREKAEREAQTKAIADARQRAVAEARDKALAEANEKLEAKAREKAAAEARDKAAEEARQKVLADAREKAAADAREKTEARLRAQAESDARVKAAEEARLAEEARKKAEPTVLAKAAKETKESSEAYSASAQPQQQASNIVPDSVAAAPKPIFPSMLTGSFVELGCGDQIKVVVQTEQGKKNFRIKNPANVIVSGKSGGTVDLNCGPQNPTNVRIQFGPGDGGYDGFVEAIYFE